jgi:DnaD/phage-associated family protein
LDFKHQVFSIISQFTGQNNIITVNVTLVDFVGDLESGLFLSQMIYWADRSKRKDGFFYKTDEEWQQEVMLSKYAVRKSRKKLEEMGLLDTKVMKANGNPTVHYRFNKSRFVEMFISFLRNRKNQIAKTEEPSFENEISITDITTDIKTDTTTTAASPFDFYQQNFGMINPFMSESIGLWIDDIGEELVIEGMKRALKQQKSWKYCEGILKDWHKHNVRTINDMNAYEKTFKEKQNNPKQPKRVEQESVIAGFWSVDDYE